MSTPVIADLEGDGIEDLIVPVSYFYDRFLYLALFFLKFYLFCFQSKIYSDPTERQKLDLDIEINKYIASGIVVFDLKSREIKWEIHLDLTTDATRYVAYIHSSPTVVDLQGDGKMEIIVGNGAGNIYVITSDGKLMGGEFPITVDSLFVSVIAEDVNGDGLLELIACDVNSNVICFSSTGEELWAVRVYGYPEQVLTTFKIFNFI